MLCKGEQTGASNTTNSVVTCEMFFKNSARVLLQLQTMKGPQIFVIAAYLTCAKYLKFVGRRTEDVSQLCSRTFDSLWEREIMSGSPTHRRVSNIPAPPCRRSESSPPTTVTVPKCALLLGELWCHLIHVLQKQFLCSG